MDTLNGKNNEIKAIIVSLLERIQAFEKHIIDNVNDKTYLSRSVDSITNDFLELDRLTQDNKSVYYRFVPLNDDLFTEVGKTTFRDQFHILDNYFHASRFDIKILKDYFWNLDHEKKNILVSILNIKNNIENIGRLITKISEVANRFVNQDKDLFEIISDMKTKNKLIKVLVVDDIEGVVFAAKNFLENRGYTTFTAGTVGEAIKSVKENAPDVVILDLNLESNMDGVNVLKFIKDNNLPVKSIISTVIDDEDRLLKINDLKPDKVLIKPFDNNQLITHINAVIKGPRI